MKVTNMVVLMLTLGLFGCSSDSLEVLRVLGTNEFSKDMWRNASQEARGTMIYSFLKNNNVSKMTVEEIKSLLGEPTAYYEYDEFPAYRVGPNSIESKYGKAYVLAFPFDRKTGIVKNYKIVPKPKK